jgi:8-oxo-dGTP pyrophosphatase MutT (NUDIX family)
MPDPPDSDTLDACALLDEVRTVAKNGLAYADDPSDVDRYERLLALATDAYADLLALPEPEVRDRLADEFAPFTPKVGGTAAVVDDDRVLAMKRPGGAWCLPGGNAEPGEHPRETAVRETAEETGLDVEPTALVDAYRIPAGSEYDPHGAVTLLYRCRRTGGALAPSAEALDFRWVTPGDVDDWFADHERYARAAQADA